MFNMVSTLITNCPAISSNLMKQLKVLSNIISESEYIPMQNSAKFNDYFGSKTAIDNYRVDFFEISDEDKNDALYLNPDESVHNQYFVYFAVKPASGNKNEALRSSYDKFRDDKMVRIMTHNRLRTRLQKLLKNVLLRRKTDNIFKQKQAFTQSHLIWIIHNQDVDTTLMTRILCQNETLRELISKVEATSNKLYNIYSSSCVVKNSFDIHFVISNIDELNRASSQASDNLVKVIQGIYEQNNKTEESFNPFIEVSQTEEKAFATTELQDRVNEAIDEVAQQLAEVEASISQSIDEWLSQNAAPELLNLEAKQQALKHKLKWEKMLTSKEKLRKLRKAIRVFKKRR